MFFYCSKRALPTDRAKARINLRRGPQPYSLMLGKDGSGHT